MTDLEYQLAGTMIMNQGKFLASRYIDVDAFLRRAELELYAAPTTRNAALYDMGRAAQELKEATARFRASEGAMVGVAGVASDG